MSPETMAVALDVQLEGPDRDGFYSASKSVRAWEDVSYGFRAVSRSPYSALQFLLDNVSEFLAGLAREAKVRPPVQFAFPSRNFSTGYQP